MFALLMRQADQREPGEIGLPLVGLEDWLCEPQQVAGDAQDHQSTVEKGGRHRAATVFHAIPAGICSETVPIFHSGFQFEAS